MVRELYINKINEVALNVTQSKVDSIRKKTIIKSHPTGWLFEL